MEKKFRNNFEMWKLKMEDLLIDRDLLDVIEEKVFRAIDPIAFVQYNVVDHKAKGLIRMCLANFALISVYEETSGKKLWKKLGEMY